MTQTIISLLSILMGIIGANIFGEIFKKYSLGIVGNTIARVFGSIFFIKSFGRLGFDTKSIIETGEIDIILLTVNVLLSLIGGGIAVVIANKIKYKMNKNETVNNEH